MKKSIKIILFLIFTIIWSIIVYLFNGEWLHFIPLLVADVIFFETNKGFILSSIQNLISKQKDVVFDQYFVGGTAERKRNVSKEEMLRVRQRRPFYCRLPKEQNAT